MDLGLGFKFHLCMLKLFLRRFLIEFFFIIFDRLDQVVDLVWKI